MCIHLVSTINPNYLVPFRVMAHSLSKTKRPETQVQWHVFAEGLSPKARSEVERDHAGSQVEFTWRNPDFDGMAALPTRGRAIPKMYERLLVPDLLPEGIDRFLYLDADLLILDDVETLWSLELDGAVIGAVQDLTVPLVSSRMGLRRYEELGFSKDAPYFNAGVYLADVAAWRQNQIGQRALEYVSRYRKSINLMDQDALNAALRNRWKPLDYRWNIIGGLAGRSHFRPTHLDPSKLAQAIASPGIIHFAGTLKPWIHSRLGSRWADAYVTTLREVFPDHRFASTLKSRSASFYDRRLRSLFYPLETSLWAIMRGF